MANVKLKLPAHISAVSHEGEELEVVDGHVMVSERVAAHLKASHGLLDPTVDRVVEPDDEPVGDEEINPDNMTKAELKAYLRGVEVEMPRGATVGDLRDLVKHYLTEQSEQE